MFDTKPMKQFMLSLRDLQKGYVYGSDDPESSLLSNVGELLGKHPTIDQKIDLDLWAQATTSFSEVWQIVCCLPGRRAQHMRRKIGKRAMRRQTGMTRSTISTSNMLDEASRLAYMRAQNEPWADPDSGEDASLWEEHLQERDVRSLLKQ